MSLQCYVLKLVSWSKHVCNAVIYPPSHWSYPLQKQVIEGRSGWAREKKLHNVALKWGERYGWHLRFLRRGLCDTVKSFRAASERTRSFLQHLDVAVEVTSMTLERSCNVQKRQVTKIPLWNSPTQPDLTHIHSSLWELPAVTTADPVALSKGNWIFTSPSTEGATPARVVSPEARKLSSSKSRVCEKMFHSHASTHFCVAYVLWQFVIFELICVLLWYFSCCLTGVSCKWFASLEVLFFLFFFWAWLRSLHLLIFIA